MRRGSVLCSLLKSDMRGSEMFSFIVVLACGLFALYYAYDTSKRVFSAGTGTEEMQKIAEWNRTTDKKMIFYALREASAYQKLSFSYIDKILQDWKNKGLTLKQIDEGTY